MSAKTKIMVIKMRELIYTAIFLVLLLLLAFLLIFMFRPKTKETSNTTSATEQSERTIQQESSQYIPGIYTTPITLGASSVDVEVTVDENHINAIRLVNLSESATAMYPLVSPSLDEISMQILEKQSLENITCPESNKYTSQMLLNAVSCALDNARFENWN